MQNIFLKLELTMKKEIILFLLLLSSLIDLKAQRTFNGVVMQQGTKTRLDSVQIYNKLTKAKVLSNSWGAFSIGVKQGDTLELSKRDYELLDIAFTDSLSSILLLKPFMGLKEVVVYGSSVKYDLSETQRIFRGKGVFYTGRPHYYYLFLKPMTFIYENFNGEVINARKFKKFAKKESDNYDISARFSEALIKKNVPIKDDEITHFKSKYRPTIEQVRTYSDYEMIDYIKKSYKEWTSSGGLQNISNRTDGAQGLLQVK